MNIRTIDIEKDKQTLLDFHSLINYECGSPARRGVPFAEDKRLWLNGQGPEEYLTALAKSLADKRTLAEVWEKDGEIIGYVWVRFYDFPEYDTTVAEIDDILVAPEYQRMGVASFIIEHVEKAAQERGAKLLRSGTGIDNIASQGLHTKMGFKTSHLEYEKAL